MGFFAKAASFSPGGDFAVADDGIYVCRLKEIEQKQQPSFDDPNVMEDKFVFVFEGANDEATDEDGKPFRFVKYTKTGYGNDKAALTQLLDGMLGKRLTKEEFSELDIDDLTSRKWRVNVQLNSNTQGKQINKILWVKPEKSGKKMGDMEGAPRAASTDPADAPFTRKAAPTPKAVISTPEDDDPFE